MGVLILIWVVFVSGELCWCCFVLVVLFVGFACLELVVSCFDLINNSCFSFVILYLLLIF